MNAISPSTIEQLLKLDLPQAEQQLASLLSLGLDPVQLGGLAASLFRHGRFQMASMIFAAWAQQRPDDPEPWSNLGLCLAKMGQNGNARDVLEHALSLNPRFAAALNNLCAVYQHLGLHAKQLENARLARELQPASALACNNLGSALLDSGMHAEAKQAFIQSLAIEPDNFEASFNLTRIALDEGRHSEAIDFLESARSGPAFSVPAYRDMTDYHLAYAYLAQGRLSEGWELYERGFSPLISPKIARRPDRQFSVPVWNGEPLAEGQRLLLWREQGIGDELRFLALLPHADLGKGQVIIETDARLVPILQRAFPFAEVREQRLSADSPEDYHAHLPVGSLPRLLMRDASSWSRMGAFLQPSAFEIARFAQRLSVAGKRKRIGICWRSHQLGGARDKKYTTLPDWYKLLSAKDCVFVNLQYGDCEQELVDAERELGIQILRWDDVNLKNDLDAVLGLLRNLDGVISPSTAVVPLAGGVGTPTILMTNPTWLLLGEQDRYPWFSSVTPLVVGEGQTVADCLPRAAEHMNRWRHAS